MSLIDAQAPDFETTQHADGRGNTQSRYDYPFGITVNALGLRFFDEGEAQRSYTYAKTGRPFLRSLAPLPGRFMIKPASFSIATRITRQALRKPPTFPNLLARSG
jgi:hypothetical protein